MLANTTGAKLILLYDADQAKAARVAQELRTAVAPSLDALLSEVDAVSIATTTSAHYDVARQAIERGVHVFIEKPITDTIERGQALVDSRRAGA